MIIKCGFDGRIPPVDLLPYSGMQMEYGKFSNL